jgi:hypothetical protein
MQLGLQFFSFHGNKKTDGSSCLSIEFQKQNHHPPSPKKWQARYLKSLKHFLNTNYFHFDFITESSPE